MKRLAAGLALLGMMANVFASDEQPLAGATLLLIGESHMSINGYLVSNLPDELVAQGAKVFSYGACGASAGDWLKVKSVPCAATRVDTGTIKERPADVASTQLIGSLIDKHHPDLLVIIMGDTMASYDNKEIPKSWVWQSVSGLTKEIKTKGTRCVWVGPAWGQDGGKYKKTNARAKEFSDYLSTLVAPCTYIDSLTFSKPGEWKTFDGQHFDKWGYENWAKHITQSITAPDILSTFKHD